MNALNISSISLSSAKKIEHEFRALTPGKQKLLIKKLHPNERSFLLKIITNSNSTDKKIESSLAKKIARVNSSKFKIVQSKNSFPQFIQTIARIRDVIADHFGFLTESHANGLIQAELSKSSLVPPNVLDELIQFAETLKKPYSISEGLKNRNFLKTIKGVNFSNVSFQRSDLNRIQFIECNFNNVSFTHLKNVKFFKCRISNSLLKNSEIENCQFKDCDLSQLSFAGAKLNKVNFIRSQPNIWSFEKDSLTKFKLTK